MALHTGIGTIAYIFFFGNQNKYNWRSLILSAGRFIRLPNYVPAGVIKESPAVCELTGYPMDWINKR